MLTPAKESFVVYVGGTFERTIELWEDAAHTKHFNLTGWTVELEIEGVGKLTSGKGLTVSATEGKIEVVMTPTETSEVGPKTQAHYWLSITKGAQTWFPLDGTMEYQAP